MQCHMFNLVDLYASHLGFDLLFIIYQHQYYITLFYDFLLRTTNNYNYPK